MSERNLFTEKYAISEMDITGLYLKLNTSSTGLTASQGKERKEIQSKHLKVRGRFSRESALLLRQFINPLVLLLVFAVLISAFLGISSDTYIMIFILLTTGLFGFWQELNASRAFEKLQKIIQITYSVIREGEITELNLAEIVPGDVLTFRAGDIIPADCRIIDSNELHVNEANLTGESFPVEKYPGQVPEDFTLSKKYNCLWQGTNIISGTAKGLVVYTGTMTHFGQLQQDLTTTRETAYTRGVRKFGLFLLRITLLLSVIILVANLYFGKPIFESVLFSLALAVGMAPELLPAVMTFTMSVGARRMMKKKVIVKKLSSIFSFGEINVLCTDKTGTITKGEVSVNKIVDVSGNINELVRIYAWLNSTLQNGFSNPIDTAISKIQISGLSYAKINEVPYDFLRKRLSVFVSLDQERLMITKGAFAEVIGVCSHVQTSYEISRIISENDTKDYFDRFGAYSVQGFRVLGLAYKKLDKDKMTKEDETDMTFVGYILLEDPMKDSALDSIIKLDRSNIEVKIITGDNPYAALHVAQAIGFEAPSILMGAEVNKLSPEALMIKVKDTDVFAETEPHQKERIIKALQQSGFVVGYIGDGINDVAAIHAADVGISSNNAVNVAKEAADFVLLDKDLGVLAEGVAEGRKSFANSMKYIFVNTGSVFGNMFSVATTSLFLPFLPMLPKQILLTNFLSDIPFLAIALDEVDDDQLTYPGKWDMSFIRNYMILFGIHSSLFDFLTFYIFFTSLKLSSKPFQTGWFLESVLTELLILLVIRTQKSFFQNWPRGILLSTTLFCFLVTIFLPISPFAGILGFSSVSRSMLLALVLILCGYIITAEILKFYFFKARQRHKIARRGS